MARTPYVWECIILLAAYAALYYGSRCMEDLAHHMQDRERKKRLRRFRGDDQK